MPDRIIGIDLGTTNSVAALTRDGRPYLVPVGTDRLLPSVVGISPEGELLVGTSARNQWVVAPERTVRSIKRRMGSLQRVEMAGRSYSPQEISALVLGELKRLAEAELGEPVTRAVITVPAYFNEVQRQATLEAGRIAGLQVERILNEPTAAALAYGCARGADEDLKILVYDLGGGTFDISVIELSHGVVDVLATAGDNHLGGDDFDLRLAQMLADEFREAHGVDPRQDPRAWARLLRAAEEAKIRLSDQPVASVELDYLAVAGNGAPLHLQRELEREELTDLIGDLLHGTGEKITRALEDAGLDAGQVDLVLLVGGSTRIPAVWDLVGERTGQDPHAELDPDAVVALGAAVQAAIIAGEDVDAVLVDVTPLSLGVETADISWGGRLTKDHFSPLIRRNTTIPVRKSERFYTLHPGQERIDVRVYQGESPVASENVLLGDFRVEDLVSESPGEPAEVLIDFALDVNGILDVTVTDRTTRRETRARLEANRQRLTPDQIAESRSRIAAAGGGDGASTAGRGPESQGIAPGALDPAVAALLERAGKWIGSAELDPEHVEALGEAVEDVVEAVSRGDSEAAEEACDRLVDHLMDLEA